MYAVSSFTGLAVASSIQGLTLYLGSYGDIVPSPHNLGQREALGF